MAAWKKCSRCGKVREADQFPEESDVCSACLTAPVTKPRATRSSAVKTLRSATEPAVRDHRGTVGSGDLEVRERRARKDAMDQLAELYPDDYEQLLQAARRAEGLRS